MPLPRHILRRLLLKALASGLPRPTDTVWPPRRILAFRPDHLGDLLFTVPALRLLRTAFPDITLDLAVGPWARDLAMAIPHCRQVFTFPFPGFERRPKGNPAAPYVAALSLARKIRGAYDAAIVFRPDHWWGAMVARLAGTGHVIGYAYPEVSPFLTRSLPPDLYLHQVELSLLLSLLLTEQLPSLPRMQEPDATEASVYCPCCRGLQPVRRPLPPRLFRWEEHPLELRPELLPGPALRHPPTRQPFAVVHPGAGATIKHWTISGFGQVCRTLKVDMGMDVVITGSASEVALAQAIAQASGVEAKVLAGSTSLKELVTLMARASLAVGVDSGPMHMAVALGIPTLQLYGPTDPALFGPWGDPNRHRWIRADYPCHPCGRLDFARQDPQGGSCMLAITAEAVVDHIRQLLETTP